MRAFVRRGIDISMIQQWFTSSPTTAPTTKIAIDITITFAAKALRYARTGRGVSAATVRPAARVCQIRRTISYGCV